MTSRHLWLEVLRHQPLFSLPSIACNRSVMAEAEAVYRYESGNIAHAPKKDYGPLDFTGKLAGGLRLDIRRRAPLYCSDWTDAFLPENFQKSVSSILYLFFRLAINRHLKFFEFF